MRLPFVYYCNKVSGHAIALTDSLGAPNERDGRTLADALVPEVADLVNPPFLEPNRIPHRECDLREFSSNVPHNKRLLLDFKSYNCGCFVPHNQVKVLPIAQMVSVFARIL